MDNPLGAGQNVNTMHLKVTEKMRTLHETRIQPTGRDWHIPEKYCKLMILLETFMISQTYSIDVALARPWCIHIVSLRTYATFP
jgi:hypothetical protein